MVTDLGKEDGGIRGRKLEVINGQKGRKEEKS